MNRSIRLLLVEDNQDDAFVIIRTLEKAGFEVTATRVTGAESFGEALRPGHDWDIIISDYSLPGFTALSALKIVVDRRLDLPFIIVSGTIGEETAVAAMKAGAHDYLMKDNLARLGAVVDRELREFESRRRTRRNEEALFAATRAIAVETGATIFKSLARNLAGALEASAAVICEINAPASDRIRELVVWDGAAGRFLDAREYPIAGTACQRVVERGFCTMTGNLCELFPNDDLVGASGAKGLAGIPLFDSADRSLGMILLFFARAIDDPASLEGVLRVFALRTAAELERHKAEQQIRFQSNLIDRASDAIHVCDPNGLITFWNRGAEVLYGWSRDAVLGRELKSVPFDGHDDVERALTCVLTRGEWLGELRAKTKGGEPLWVAGRWTLLRNPEGRPDSILSITSDITEKKRLEQQFLRAQRLEAIGTLASGLAHDLNNVLAPVLMAAECLKEKHFEPGSAELIDSIRSSTVRGMEIVKQVLTFAKGMGDKRGSVHPGAVISEIAAMVEKTFPKNIDASFDLSEDLGIVRGDATQLHQILLNLCLNARDAMPDGGTLTVRARNVHLSEKQCLRFHGASPRSYVRIEVTDSGHGIAEPNLSRIFEPFFTTKPSGRGTGLGLSTSLGLVKGHGGFVDVESQVNVGTKLVVFLPEDSPTAAKAVPDGQRANGKADGEGDGEREGELILVVDDEAAIRRVVGRALALRGFRTVTAHDGASALELLAAPDDPPRLVLTDLLMPGMDGVTFIRAIRKRESGVAVIVMTGQIDGVVRNELDDLGVAAVILKPFSMNDLIRQIEHVAAPLSLENVRRNPAPEPGNRRS